jgi:hypothetical protein
MCFLCYLSVPLILDALLFVVIVLLSAAVPVPVAVVLEANLYGFNNDDYQMTDKQKLPKETLLVS